MQKIAYLRGRRQVLKETLVRTECELEDCEIELHLLESQDTCTTPDLTTTTTTTSTATSASPTIPGAVHQPGVMTSATSLSEGSGVDEQIFIFDVKDEEPSKQWVRKNYYSLRVAMPTDRPWVLHPCLTGTSPTTSFPDDTYILCAKPLQYNRDLEQWIVPRCITGGHAHMVLTSGQSDHIDVRIPSESCKKSCRDRDAYTKPKEHSLFLFFWCLLNGAPASDLVVGVPVGHVYASGSTDPTRLKPRVRPTLGDIPIPSAEVLQSLFRRYPAWALRVLNSSEIFAGFDSR
eukprot:TRINITY_DN2293_c0_g1_i1.p1 TRINITY_DN2293_c0_g1~~TRINITY_DN2293_c0_g1_i1.p1  ORF type:complete len:290 (+),score=13.72 TRINITY_DN2293_c0_g1_i1:291-1160(+)